MRNILFVIVFSFFFISCHKSKKHEIEIGVEKKQMLNNHCLLIKLIIRNNTSRDYLVPITPNFNLENNKKMLQSIPSRIITYDFMGTPDDRQEFLLQEFAEKSLYKGFSHEVYKMAILKDYEGYANSLFFIPKNSKRELFLSFNDYTYPNDKNNSNKIFNDKFTKIRIDYYPKEVVTTIDSLINHNKLSYSIYSNKVYLEDSLFIK